MHSYEDVDRAERERDFRADKIERDAARAMLHRLAGELVDAAADMPLNGEDSQWSASIDAIQEIVAEMRRHANTMDATADVDPYETLHEVGTDVYRDRTRED